MRRILASLLAVHLLWAVTLAAAPCGAVTVPPGTEQLSFGSLPILSPTGEQIPLVAHIGTRTVVVVFWATWCPLCRNEVPQLNRLAADPAVTVVAVNGHEDRDKVLRFMATHDVRYTVAMDPDGTVARAFRAPGIPYCVIMGKSGNIMYRGSMLPEKLDYYTSR